MDEHSQVLERLRESFRSGVTKPEEFRRAQLKKLLCMINENEEQIIKAVHEDFAKPKFEATLSEVAMVVGELEHAIANLKSWMQPEYVSKNLATKLDDCFIRREPLGVVLIIAPWNYPVQLAMLPLVAAIAAGNCAIIKPSEVTAATVRMIAELIPKYLSQDCYAVVQGGPEETRALLKNRFDHIFYTGSQAVARSIMVAAAVHLTPVTLELGGKCPSLMYGRVNIATAARRLAWAKFFNAGQSCVAPDYVLCSRETRDALVPALHDAIKDFYGEDPKACPDLARIVSPRHWTYLMDLLERSKGKVVMGGETDEKEKYIAPTLIVDVAEDDSLMEKEIFGPLLPILTYETLEEALAFVNRQEKPLALYVYSEDSSVVTATLEGTCSGGFCSNDGIVHMTLPTLPFGGIGASGWGRYHGRWGFETFSHQRAVMLRGWALERLNGLRYPPYSDSKLDWLCWTTRVKISCSIM